MDDTFDEQLKFSQILPDFQQWLDWMAAESSKVQGWEPRSYGEDPRQWIETRGSPPADGIVPVFFHGGYWRALEASAHRFTALGLEAMGPMQVNAEYRLMPGARMADLIDDAAHALELAARIAPGAVLLVIGHSAGAHLAFWAVQRSELPVERIAGVVTISGIYDLAPVRRSFLQEEISLTEDEAAGYSPLSVEPRQGIRRLILVGEDETPLYHDQAGRFREKTEADLSVVGRTHHMSVLAGLGRAGSPLAVAVDRFAQGQDIPDLIRSP